MASSNVKTFTISSHDERRRFIRHNPLFRDLPEETLEALVKMSRLRHLPDRALLHAKGDPPEGMYGVISGCIRASSSTAEGREVLLALMEPGSWLGESSMFDGLPRTYDAYAQGDTELLVIPRASLEELLEVNPRLYRYFVQLLCQRIRLSMLLLESNALLPLEGRLANRLLLMARNAAFRHGENDQPSLRLAQEDLSQMLGTSRQSINKLLKEWEQAGIIHRHYRGITLLDLPALERRAQAYTPPAES